MNQYSMYYIIIFLNFTKIVFSMDADDRLSASMRQAGNAAEKIRKLSFHSDGSLSELEKSAPHIKTASLSTRKASIAVQKFKKSQEEEEEEDNDYDDEQDKTPIHQTKSYSKKKTKKPLSFEIVDPDNIFLSPTSHSKTVRRASVAAKKFKTYSFPAPIPFYQNNNNEDNDETTPRLNSKPKAQIEELPEEEKEQTVGTTPTILKRTKKGNFSVSLWNFVEISTISSVATYYLYTQIQQAKAIPKRFITGMEPAIAVGVLQKVGSTLSSAIPCVLAFYGFFKIKNWIHSGCRSERELLTERFESKVKETKLAIENHKQDTNERLNDYAEQVTIQIQEHRAETAEVFETITDALEHTSQALNNIATHATQLPTEITTELEQAANILQVGAKDATSSTQQMKKTASMPVLKQQKINSKKCCGGCCMQ